MATIKQIEARSIHQIQSGQVIVDLCSVVKELVENSLDAGATTIEVRFKNQGLDSIEVQDNGAGISPDNYESLALKHYTSKLSSYEDLSTLQTFGFRGEALSSLCALSKFTVTTCQATEAPKGTKLEFETSGKLCGTSVVASQRGTTVSVETLFQNLPVRRRELERNVKREWNKVIGILNQYACIQTGLKFTVSQQPTKGKRIVLFSTKGNKTTRENIVNVFGAKTLTVLIPLDLELELESTAITQSQRSKADITQESKKISVYGHVSRPAHGEGRQTPDRQMFFVNSRPCGLPQFAKVFNEVYKSYNSTQSPFIFADIQLDTHLYDVNVSPDKRTILLHEQSRMLDNLREALVALFESQDYAMPMSQLTMAKLTPFRKSPFARSNSDEDRLVADVERQVSTNPAASTALPTRNGGVPQEENTPSSHHERGGGESRAESTSRTSTPIQENPDRRSPKKAVDQKVSEEDDDDDARASSEDVPDFRMRLSQFGKPASGGKPLERNQNEQSSDPPIPAIFTRPRVADMRGTQPSPSRNLKRAAPEVATITIGGDTVTSVIGGPPSKSPRLAPCTPRKPPKPQSKKASVPSFKGRLTQMFAAYSQGTDNDDTKAELEVGVEDSEERGQSESEDGLFVDQDDDQSSSLQDVDMEGSGSETPRDGPNVPETDLSAMQKKYEQALAQAEDSIQEMDQTDEDPQEEEGTGEEAEEKSADADEGGDDDGQSDELSKNIADGDIAKTLEEAQKRTNSLLKGGGRRKDATVQLQHTLRLDTAQLYDTMKLSNLTPLARSSSGASHSRPSTDALDAEDAEEKLSLTISKADFGKMRVIGQFNLGFILAVRPKDGAGHDADDELFIIDQHATDEKYNFERLQATTTVQSQRLVQPKPLELTALEEEVLLENVAALEANGFQVHVDESGDEPVGSRCRLLSLPLSRETTFGLPDLEELISLLTEHPPSDKTIPRPSKVRKMFAMRACRSSVMIGRALTTRQMTTLVRHMGELDKPWNCPHGRPTMRHLCGLAAWGAVDAGGEGMGWREDDLLDGSRPPRTDWTAYLQG